MNLNLDCFIGIDLGTSSCKVVLTDTKGKIFASHRVNYSVEIGEGGKAEQDPRIWVEAMKDGVRKILHMTDESYSVRGIGLTGQWSGTVPLSSDGKELYKAIIWMDTRGKKHVQKLTSGFPSISGYRVDKLVRWLRKTAGVPAHSGKDSLAHILYIKNEIPELYQRTYKFLEPKDYLAFKLTGEFKASWDNISLLWVTDNRNPNLIKYDDELIEATGIDKGKLPELISPIDVVGKLSQNVAAELGLPGDVSVISGSGDMQCSIVGAGSVGEGSLLLYAGTSLWITAHTTYKKTDIFHNIASLPSALPGYYFVAAEQENAGNCLEYISRLLSLEGENKYTTIEDLVSSSPAGAKNLVFLPWLFGERTPVEDPYIRGGFYNLSLEHDKGDFLRAVMEGVAYNSKWLLSTVEKFISRSKGPLTMSGGVALSSVWPKIFADVFEREIRVVENPNFSTARGAAMIASIGLGYLKAEEIESKISKVYTPDERNFNLYRKRYYHFVNYYWRNRKDMKKLNS